MLALHEYDEADNVKHTSAAIAVIFSCASTAASGSSSSLASFQTRTSESSPPVYAILFGARHEFSDATDPCTAHLPSRENARHVFPGGCAVFVMRLSVIVAETKLWSLLTFGVRDLGES